MGMYDSFEYTEDLPCPHCGKPLNWVWQTKSLWNQLFHFRPGDPICAERGPLALDVHAVDVIGQCHQCFQLIHGRAIIKDRIYQHIELEGDQ